MKYQRWTEVVFSAVVGFEKFASFKIVSQNHKIFQELQTL
jgi:hypothetical protein